MELRYTVYVTHDQAEALTLSDQIAVIDQANVIQIGTPREIYFRPANDFVAKFVGSTNLLNGKVVGTEGDTAAVEIAQGQRLACVKTGTLQNDAEVSVSIRPETIRLSQSDQTRGTGVNRLSGKVRHVAFLGDACRVDVQVGETLVQVKGAPDLALANNVEVELVFDANNTLAVPKAG